jgi:hypothetical protein
MTKGINGLSVTQGNQTSDPFAEDPLLPKQDSSSTQDSGPVPISQQPCGTSNQNGGAGSTNNSTKDLDEVAAPLYGAAVGNKVFQNVVSSCLAKGWFYDRQKEIDILAGLTADEFAADPSQSNCTNEDDCFTYKQRLEAHCVEPTKDLSIFGGELPTKCTQKDIEEYFADTTMSASIKTFFSDLFTRYQNDKEKELKFDQCIICEVGATDAPCLLKRQTGDIPPANRTIKVWAVEIVSEGGKAKMSQFASDGLGLVFVDKIK